jgi:tRNA(adenine34) deaminase
MKPSKQDTESMRQLLALLIESVDAAGSVGADVPVAAGIFDTGGNLLSWALNQREATGDPTAHAEVLVLREAAQLAQSGWRLEDCTLVVTLEPCAMCAGAVLNARVPRVVYGASEPKTGAAGSVVDILRDPRNLHQPEVIGGVLGAECSQFLKSWFVDLRDTKDVLADG